MANYTEDEQRLIIRLYREYCQCKQNTFKLLSEDKLILMQHLKSNTEFDVMGHEGYIFYRRFPLPYCLPQQSNIRMRREAGEGLSSRDHEILNNIQDRIQVEALINIWDDGPNDVCILFAAMIEASLGAKVLPRVSNEGVHILADVSTTAKTIWKKRKQDKIKAAKKQIKDHIYEGLGKNH